MVPAGGTRWWLSWCPEVARCGGGHGAPRWHNVVVVMVPRGGTMWWLSWCPEVAQCGGCHGAPRWHNVVVVVMVPRGGTMWWWSWCPEVAQCGGGHGAPRCHNVVVVMVPRGGLMWWWSWCHLRWHSCGGCWGPWDGSCGCGGALRQHSCGSDAASTSLTKKRAPAESGEHVKPPVEGSKGTTQFRMGDDLPPVPAKVIEKILIDQFIDMAELLRDNMEVERRRSTLESASVPAQPTRREVPDLLSREQCFGVLPV